jgi:hypothetical protein
MDGPAVSGSLLVLFCYDLSDAIRLDEVRRIIGAPPKGREPAFRHAVPEYVQFARPPVVETLPPLRAAGQVAGGKLSYYDYGVVTVQFDIGFEGGWSDLIALSARWMNAPELEQQASAIVRERMPRIASALATPNPRQLTEDYYIIHLRTCLDQETGLAATAAELMERHGDAVAQIIRGERARFSRTERAEILESRMSYYENDLLVVGWSAAFIYDTPEGALPTIQLLEYANTQLLEFRYYDEVLTDLLSQVYRLLERGVGPFARWRLANEADRLNTIRLDIRELTERVDNSIKFLSDMFSARLYRMAATRIGVPDYRTLVEQKLQSAGELYGFMMDRFYQGRAFVLELMVVIILIIELVYLFRGMPAP